MVFENGLFDLMVPSKTESISNLTKHTRIYSPYCKRTRTRDILHQRIGQLPDPEKKQHKESASKESAKP